MFKNGKIMNFSTTTKIIKLFLLKRKKGCQWKFLYMMLSSSFPASAKVYIYRKTQDWVLQSKGSSYALISSLWQGHFHTVTQIFSQNTVCQFISYFQPPPHTCICTYTHTKLCYYGLTIFR